MSKSTKQHEKNRKKKGFRFALSEETNRIIDHLALKRNCTRSELVTEAITSYYLEAKYLEECQEQYKNLNCSVELTPENLKLDDKQTDIFNKVSELNKFANNVNKPGK